MIKTKIYDYLKFFFKIKVFLKKPRQSEVVVIDSTSIYFLRDILKGFNWNLIETRNNLIKEIYITPRIIFNFFLNLRSNFKIAYIVSLINEISPKIVLTFIDNSQHFFSVVRSFKNKKIKFIAIQNGVRLDVYEADYFFKKKLIKYNLNKNIYLPYFFCHGENEIRKYKKYKIKVKKFIKIGSLRLFSAINNGLQKLSTNFDVCLISNTTWQRELTSKDESFARSYAKLVKYTIEFVKEKKLKFIFCLKSSYKSIYDQNYELSILKKYLSKKHFNFLKKNIKYKKYSTYCKALSSKVVVGATSTILGECLSLGKKVFICNFSNLSYCDFPIKGVCFSKKDCYYDFKKKLNKVLICSDSYYFKNLSQKKNYIVDYNKDINPNAIVKNFIENKIKNFANYKT